VLTFTRSSNRFLHGLSPRAGLGLLRAAKAAAHLDGRDYVLPEDVQEVLPAVVPHRLISSEDNSPVGHAEIAGFILDAVPVA
jgi:MoxR-like ATPase